MRVLGIETSSVHGSVALVDNGTSVCTLGHERANAHGESIMPLVEEALAVAGWNRRELDRIAVGIGPGSFTGLRVGIAIAQGLSEGLEIPLVGVPSLQVMAWAVPAELRGGRCVLVDARKGEAFVAAYLADGREALPVQLVSDLGVLRHLIRGLPDPVIVGNGAALFPDLANIYRSVETDYPHARWAALLAGDAEPTPYLRPLYVRDAVAAVPKLPDNPLAAAAERGQ
jgi:tRNA threonylcarbamoyladenosine biosynthesis protein TsaB